MSWDAVAPGVLVLPGGRLVRGRGLRRPLPAGPLPELGLYLGTREPGPFPWESRLLRWPDWRLPSDPQQARAALHEVWDRADGERVEVACAGGRGRTGTALACLAVLGGAAPADAVAHVRAHYSRGAVETPWQRRYVTRFAVAERS